MCVKFTKNIILKEKNYLRLTNYYYLYTAYNNDTVCIKRGCFVCNKMCPVIATSWLQWRAGCGVDPRSPRPRRNGGYRTAPYIIIDIETGPEEVAGHAGGPEEQPLAVVWPTAIGGRLKVSPHINARWAPKNSRPTRMGGRLGVIIQQDFGPEGAVNFNEVVLKPVEERGGATQGDPYRRLIVSWGQTGQETGVAVCKKILHLTLRCA